jgi:hypothetical protein
MSDDQSNESGNRRAAGIGSWGTVQWDDGTVSTGRPDFALEGHADEVYHEPRIPGRQTEPEYCAFLGQSRTFNRAMRWAATPNRTVLAYEAAGNLELTGEARVSDWFSDPANPLQHAGCELTFEKRSARQREVVALPELQVNLDQHPILSVTVSDATAQWQVCVLIKSRTGPPLLASNWHTEPGSVTLDLAAAIAAKGYALHFAAVHIVVGLWTETPEAEASITFAASMAGHAALVPCLPVVRTAQNVEKTGMPISAVVIDADGQIADPQTVQVTARSGDHFAELIAVDGVWSGSFTDLPAGEYEAELTASGAIDATSVLVLRVTDGIFLSYESDAHSLVRDGKVQGPLSGSAADMAFVRDIGTPEETLVQGQAELDANPDAEHWHYWDAMTEAELTWRFEYLQSCGWDLIHLLVGWGIWEKLDACGHIIPRAAEQLALVMRLAARHGLVLEQAVSHYPYGTSQTQGNQTPVLRQYLEAGFKDEDWTHPGNGSRFDELFHGYLQDFADMYRDETVLFCVSTSGEGDIAAGPERVNDAYRFMQKQMPNHIYIIEPIHRLFDLPDAHRAAWIVHEWTAGFPAGCRTDVAWEAELAGSRMYWMGMELKPELDLAIELKFLQLGDYFMGEGSWPCPHLYKRFMGQEDTWCGTEFYRRRLRDNLYLGLIHRIPLLITWGEQHAEDERIVFRQVRDAVDWSQAFLQAPVAIRVDGTNVGSGPDGSDGRLVLEKYEAFFSALPLMTSYVQPGDPEPDGVTMLDATESYTAPTLTDDANKAFRMRQPFGSYTAPTLIDDVLSSGPLRVSADYRASYLWSADRQTLIAYFYNCTNHIVRDGHVYLAGNLHRMPEPVACTIDLQNFPAQPLLCQVFSLNEKCCVRTETIHGSSVIDMPESDDDYLVLVSPTEA